MNAIALNSPIFGPSIEHRLRASIASRLAAVAATLNASAIGVVLEHATALPAPAGINVGKGRKAGLLGGVIHALTAFTNAGTAVITNRIIQAGTAAKNIGWGVGVTAAAITQTALVTESAPTTAGGRTIGTESRTTATNTNDQYTVTGTVTAGSTLAITEAGTFDAVTAGNMLIRSDFAAVNVVSGDSIAFTFNLKFVSSAV